MAALSDVDQGSNTTFDGTLNGRGSLTKEGVGTLTLRGSAPEVDAEILVGVVLVDGGSLGPVIASQDGALSLRNNGTVGEFESPNGRFGNNASGIGRSGDFTLNFLHLQPISSQTQFGKLFVTRDVRLNQPLLDVNVLGGYHPNPGTKFIIVDNDGSDAVKGGFRQLPEGADFETDGVRFRISYVDGTGNDISLTVVGQPANPPDLTIDKQHTGDFAAGQPGRYTIVVSNIGSGPSVSLVTVTDVLPNGYVPTAASGTAWECAIVGQKVECSRQDPLGAGSAYPAITIVVQLSPSAATAVNEAIVAGGGDTTTPNDSDQDRTTVVSAIDLKISKRAGQAFVHTGPASYTLDVENVGAGTTIGMVTVTDTMPAGLTAIKASGDGWTCDVSDQVVTCTRTTTVAPGASFPPISIDATIPASAPDSLVNTATVAGGGDTVPGNNTATIVTPVGGAVTPDLTIGKTHDDPFTQGQVGATFTVTVSNQGKGPTAGTVTVIDTLPAGLTGTAAGLDWTCTANAQSVTCTRSDSLAAGQSYPAISLTVNVSPTASSATNTVIVSGGGDGTAGNNTATDPVTVTPTAPDVSADLTISKSHSGVVTQGGAVSFSIVVRNVGAASSTGEVVVTDTLPQGLTPTTATGPGWSCVMATSTVTCRRSNDSGCWRRVRGHHAGGVGLDDRRQRGEHGIGGGRRGRLRGQQQGDGPCHDCHGRPRAYDREVAPGHVQPRPAERRLHHRGP